MVTSGLEDLSGLWHCGSHFDTNLLQMLMWSRALQAQLQNTYVDPVVNLTKTILLIKTITALSQSNSFEI